MCFTEKDYTLALKSWRYGSADHIISASGHHSWSGLSHGSFLGNKKWGKFCLCLQRALLEELDGINNDGKTRRKVNFMGKDSFRYNDFYSFIQQILHACHVPGAIFLPSWHTDQWEAWHINKQWQYKALREIHHDVHSVLWEDQELKELGKVSAWVTYWNEPESRVGWEGQMGTAGTCDYMSQCRRYSHEANKELTCLEAEALN